MNKNNSIVFRFGFKGFRLLFKIYRYMLLIKTSCFKMQMEEMRHRKLNVLIVFQREVCHAV